MAKLTAPLFSLKASGKLANTLVYMSWKGIEDVRQYVIPANPNTAKQQTQRGYFADAVDEWHTAGFTSDDISAWNRYALSLKKPLSGFNAFLSLFLKAKVAGNSWTSLKNVQVSSVTSSGFQVDVDCSADETAKLYYGTSPTNMTNEVSGTYSGGTWIFTLSGLSSSTKYYFYIKNTAAGESARTGIYMQETS